MSGVGVGVIAEDELAMHYKHYLCLVTVTHSDLPLRRNHSTALRIWKESQREKASKPRIGSAVRICSHQLPDPLFEGKIGTGNYLSSYPCGTFLTSSVPWHEIFNSPSANIYVGLETSATMVEREWYHQTDGVSASWNRNPSTSPTD